MKTHLHQPIIAICVGEASGDLLGAHLLTELKKQCPHARFIGIGGPRMIAQGFESLFEQEKLAVRGYVEVIKKLPEILRIRRQLLAQLKNLKPDVFVGIDAPDFNLGVAAQLKAAGIPTVHYVSPSIWAWKSERVHQIVKQVHRVLCLFPMEAPLYHAAGGQADFVGHPLAQSMPLEVDKIQMRQRLKLPETIPIFTIMPGSRVSEIDYMLPVYLRTAQLILQTLPNAQFLLPYPTAAARDRIQFYLKKEEFKDIPIRLQVANAHLACIASDVVLVSSGTATLEVALCKRPMVISYKISNLTYYLVKHKIKVPHVGLPNILLGKEVVPELLQHEATPEKLAHALLDWYHSPERVKQLELDFIELHQMLKKETSQLAAQAILNEAGLCTQTSQQ